MTEEQKQIRRDRAKAWIQANRDRHNRSQALYRIRNSDKLRERRMADPQRRSHQRTSSEAFRSRHPWYNAWQCARQRCVNPKNPSYQRYGARGVLFKLTRADMAFLWVRDKAWLLERPSIDRINPDGHYEMDNCQWIELSHNSRKASADAKARREVSERSRGVSRCQESQG